jgi:hypothetical protein
MYFIRFKGNLQCIETFIILSALNIITASKWGIFWMLTGTGEMAIAKDVEQKTISKRTTNALIARGKHLRSINVETAGV